MSTNSVRRWTLADLVALIPGTTGERWRGTYLPVLVASGVLTADGEAWLGRRVDIERTLSGATHEGMFRWLETLRAHANYPNAAIALATGGMSLIFHLATATPLLVVGAGLLAGAIAESRSGGDSQRCPRR